jgi:hypothetical protein
MTLKRKIVAAFKMSDEAWLRRANPWGEWTSFIILVPLLNLVFWSRIWLGWWSLLMMISYPVIWIWLRSHVFPKPRSTNNWISKGVLGERVWLNRDQVPVPQHHRRVPNLLDAIIPVGATLLCLGVANSDVRGVVFGYTLVSLGRLWYLDRMVWLYGEMKDVNPEYRSWLY